MIGLMDYTRWIAVSAALAVFAISQTAIPNEVARAAFVDQPSPAFTEPLSDQSLNLAKISDLAPQVRVDDSRVAVGQRVSVPITLSSAPNGLAGYQLLVDLGDANTARIVGVEFPQFGIVFEQPGYGELIRLAAADLYQIAESGTADLTLAVVTLEGVSAGSVGAQLTILQIDDDEGNVLPVSVSSGTVSVY